VIGLWGSYDGLASKPVSSLRPLRTRREAGCSNAQIKAITNHETDAMVAHYASGARQKILAREARNKTSKNKSG